MTDRAAALAASRRELGRLIPALHALADDLDAETLRTRPAPDEWSPVEILCHLRDEESEDFGARLRAVLDGATSLARIEPDRWPEQRGYRNQDAVAALAELKARRSANLDFLAGLDSDRLGATISLGKLGPLSALDLLVAWVEHDQQHLAQLIATRARLWADRWPSLRADYAGPIPYPKPAAAE